MKRIPITQENFPKAWNYSCKKLKAAKKRTLIRKLAVPVSQILFFLCFLALSYGVAYDGFPKLVRDFLSKIPFAALIWQRASTLFLDSAGCLSQQLLRMALFLYGLPLAAAGLLWLLTVLLYHPRKPTLSQDPELHPRDLQSAAQQAWEYRTPRHVSSIPFLSILMALILTGGFVTFLFYYHNNPAIYNWLQDGMAQAGFYFLLGCLLVFLFYFLLNLPLRWVVSLLYRCRISPEFLEEAEKYRQTELRRQYQKAAAREPAPEKEAPEPVAVPAETFPDPDD